MLCSLPHPPCSPLVISSTFTCPLQIMDGYYHKGFALFNLKQYAEAVSA